jgi:hypothetical protein
MSAKTLHLLDYQNINKLGESKKQLYGKYTITAFRSLQLIGNIINGQLG